MFRKSDFTRSGSRQQQVDGIIANVDADLGRKCVGGPHSTRHARMQLAGSRRKRAATGQAQLGMDSSPSQCHRRKVRPSEQHCQPRNARAKLRQTQELSIRPGSPTNLDTNKHASRLPTMVQAALEASVIERVCRIASRLPIAKRKSRMLQCDTGLGNDAERLVQRAIHSNNTQWRRSS
jgi:hypothetical protein